MALRRFFSPGFQAAESVLFIHWRVVAAPRGGPAITFLWNDGGAGRAMGSAAPRPARNGGGMALRRFFSPAFQAAESVLFIHWRVVAAPRGGPAITFLWNDGGAGRAMGSASSRPARNGVGMALRRVFSPAFQAAESVLFIHWR